MKNYKIAILAGDGIGPEIMKEAIKVLELIQERNNVTFELMPALFGASAYFDCGNPFPDETIAICDKADAILKGTIGLSHEEAKIFPSNYNLNGVLYCLCASVIILTQISVRYTYPKN